MIVSNEERLERADILDMSSRMFGEFLNIVTASGVECYVHKFLGDSIELVFSGAQPQLNRLWRWFRIRGHDPFMYAFDGKGKLFISVELKYSL